jgi:hypothetical protein
MIGSQRVWPHLQHGDRTVRTFFGQFAGSVFVRAEDDALGVEPVAVADISGVGTSNGFDNVVVSDWLAQLTADRGSNVASEAVDGSRDAARVDRFVRAWLNAVRDIVGRQALNQLMAN